MKIKDYRDAQLHYTKDDRGDATGAFEMFVAEEPSSMVPEPRRTGFKSGGSYDYGSMQYKIDSVNAAYKRYKKSGGKKLSFDQFAPIWAAENFAEGGQAGQLVQPNAQGERIGFKDGTPVKFDESRVKIPTGKFVGEGRDKSQIFKIKNTKTGTVRYITTGAGGGVKKAYKSIKELKDAKLESLPDEFFVQSETPYKNGIKEITSKNRKTGETKVFYKPRVGPDKATLPGKGAETKKEAQKFIDNYFKENPKQVRVRDPEKDYASKDVRKKALKETDLTKAEGTPRFNYHHVRQIAGGVPLTTDDVMIINQRINSSLGTKYNKPLNAISAAIQKNNRLALEAMNNKQEGLALDYMKRVDELNTSAEKIVNSAIDKLPEKYKGYVGFNKFTLPTNEYGLPISNEPMIIKKVGGMPVSKDAVDLTTLDLKQEKEFRKIVKAQAEAGKTGKINNKKLVKFFKDAGIPCIKGVGGNCTSIGDYQKGYNKLVEEGAQGSKQAIQKLGKFTKTMREITGVAKYTGYGLLAEAGFMIPFAVGDYAAGKKWSRIIGNATDYGFGPIFGQSELEEFKEALPKRSAAVQAENVLSIGDEIDRMEKQKVNPGYGRIGFQEKAPIQRQKVYDAKLDKYFLNMQPFIRPNPQIDAGQFYDQNLFDKAMQEGDAAREKIMQEDLIRQQRRDLSKPMDFMAAGGGIAGLSGGDKSGRPPESGPASQGLRSLYKNGRKL